jgi:hypothetical protein
MAAYYKHVNELHREEIVYTWIMCDVCCMFLPDMVALSGHKVLHLSQGIAEIRHFRKCLDFPQLPSQLQKNNLIDNVQILGNSTVSVENYF